MWFRKPQSVSCFEKSHSLLSTISANKMSSLVGERSWAHSLGSKGTSKEEIAVQAHTFLLDLACCRINLQPVITENPQRKDYLVTVFIRAVDGGEQVGLRTGISGCEPIYSIF